MTSCTPLAAGLLDDLFLISGDAVIEHLVRALLPRQASAAVGAGRAEHAQARGARHLDGSHAHRAAGAVNQDRLARLRPAFLEQRAPRGDVRDTHRRALLKRNVRSAGDAPDRACTAPSARTTRSARPSTVPPM